MKSLAVHGKDFSNPEIRLGIDFLVLMDWLCWSIGSKDPGSLKFAVIKRNLAASVETVNYLEVGSCGVQQMSLIFRIFKYATDFLWLAQATSA